MAATRQIFAENLMRRPWIAGWECGFHRPGAGTAN